VVWKGSSRCRGGTRGDGVLLLVLLNEMIDMGTCIVCWEKVYPAARARSDVVRNAQSPL
jgi:hypothetical protein